MDKLFNDNYPFHYKLTSEGKSEKYPFGSIKISIEGNSKESDKSELIYHEQDTNNERTSFLDHDINGKKGTIELMDDLSDMDIELYTILEKFRTWEDSIGRSVISDPDEFNQYKKHEWINLSEEISDGHEERSKIFERLISQNNLEKITPELLEEFYLELKNTFHINSRFFDTMFRGKKYPKIDEKTPISIYAIQPKLDTPDIKETKIIFELQIFLRNTLNMDESKKVPLQLMYQNQKYMISGNTSNSCGWDNSPGVKKSFGMGLNLDNIGKSVEGLARSFSE